MGIRSVHRFMSKFSSHHAFFYFVVGMLSLFSVEHLQAQDPKKQYKNAKEFFTEGKYNLAMESFKTLLIYDKSNPYVEYASFYYALSAQKQNYFAVAKDMLLQIKKLYPEWDQMNEVNYWLAKLYFDQREHFQGMHVLQEVKQEDFIEMEEIAKLKRHYLIQITDPEILRMMWEDYPNDQEVGRALARCISLQERMQQDKDLLESVITAFGFPREQYVSRTSLPVFKETYHVSVLFPFLATTLDPSPTKKQNQVMLDLYEGMRMANDSLGKQGTHINLLAYDTEGSPNDFEKSQGVLKQLLDLEELKNTDLIVGPLFRSETKIVQQFSEKNQTNMIHPVSNSSEFVGQNPFAFLFQPSNETLGAKSAELLASRIKNKNCMIMYGDKPKDSVMATNFSARAKELGMNIVWMEQFRRETAGRIISILSTPTEFDEFKDPIQFTLKIDSIGSVFVASDEPLIYTKVISSVDTRRDSVIIVGSEIWLDNTSVDLTKYERLHVMLAAPTYTSLNLPAFIDFRKRFIKRHGAFPPEYYNYSKIGYDFMMFIGQAMKKYGVYFQEGLLKEGLMPGALSRGYRLSSTRDNLEVPFVFFRHGELIPVE